MKREDIIRMAREAGGIDMTNNIAGGVTTWIGTGTPQFIERFAGLVAAAERGACAKVCEDGVNNAEDWDSSYWDQACENRAAAIRARGNN